jgi:hypothetical protein
MALSPSGDVALGSESVTETLVGPLRRPTFHGGTLNMKAPKSLFDRPGRAAATAGAVVAVSATAVVALVSGTATATPAAGEPSRCAKNVNVRAEPDPTSRIVALCEQGTEVKVGESRDGFVQLTNLGGWAAQEYVSVNGQPPAPAERATSREGEDADDTEDERGDDRDTDGGEDGADSGPVRTDATDGVNVGGKESGLEEDGSEEDRGEEDRGDEGTEEDDDEPRRSGGLLH